jgi:long-chain acyl-CoA synthetase
VISVQAPPSADRYELSRLEDEAAVATPIKTYVARNPADIATILYTSGTTGKPKGAEASHRALLTQTTVLLLNTFDISEHDRVLGALPLFHSFGQTCTMNTVFRAAATLVLLPRFDGKTALDTMILRQCTIFMGVPTMYLALLEAAAFRRERPPLRYAISGGAAIPVAVIQKFRESYGTEIFEGYGLTETSPVATFNHLDSSPRYGTVGTPIWGVNVEIADPAIASALSFLPNGAVGEIVIRGHNLMNGYHNRPEDTDAAIVDGWFRSGDLGHKSADGYITIVDRTKDMIIRSGYNVYPREIEEVLARHPAISAVAVYGIPHPIHGEEVVASVVLLSEARASEDELIGFAKSEVAAYKYPRHIQFVSSLPLGPSGKVLKRELVKGWKS